MRADHSPGHFLNPPLLPTDIFSPQSVYQLSNCAQVYSLRVDILGAGRIVQWVEPCATCLSTGIGIPHWEGEDRKGISGTSWLTRLAERRRSRMYMERNVRSGLTCVLRKMTQVVGTGWEGLLLQNLHGAILRPQAGSARMYPYTTCP